MKNPTVNENCLANEDSIIKPVRTRLRLHYKDGLSVVR